MRLARSVICVFVCLVAGALVCHSEQPSTTLCSRIAKAAATSNQNLNTSEVERERTAPFVKDWLVQFTVDETSPPKNRFRANKALFESDPHLYEYYTRWDRAVGFLPFDGRFLTVLASADYTPFRNGWSTGVYIKSIFDDGVLACAFDNHIHENIRSHAEGVADTQACREILTNEDHTVEFQKTYPLEASEALFPSESERGSNQGFGNPPWTSIIVNGSLDLDVNGDGIDERLVSINYSPMSGICGYQYYDVLKADGTLAFEQSRLRDLVLRAQEGEFPSKREMSTDMTTPSLGRCYRRTHLRREGGKVFFEREGVDAGANERQKRNVTTWGGPLQRTVRVIDGNKVKTACSSTFSIEPLVVYDREMAERLENASP